MVNAQHEQTNPVSDKGQHAAGQPSIEIASSAPLSPTTLHNLRRQDVLQLQRLVGNRAVQRLVKTGRLSLRPSSVIQRADAPAAPAATESTDQGLLDDAAETRFARIIQTYASDPSNANVDLPTFAGVLMDELNNELDVIGVPRASAGGPAGAKNNGEFDSEHWQMGLNLANVFDSELLKVGELAQPQLLQAVHTVYHEGRHAEQFFLIARMRAANLLADNKTPEQAKVALVAALKYPQNVIDAAVANPLTNASKETLNAVKEWDSSLSPDGANNAYREMVVFMRTYTVKSIENGIQQVLKAVPDGKPVDQVILNTWIKFAEEQMDHLFEDRDTKIKPELDRLAAIPVPATGQTAGDKAMRDHLKNLNGLVDQVAQYLPIGPDPVEALMDSSNILQWLVSFSNEISQAERDLPQEADADKAGNQAAQKFADAANGEE